MRPEIRSFLGLGLGSGSVGSHLARTFPGLTVTYVEIDPAVPEIARRLLAFREGPAMRVEIADARRFLVASDAAWDYIYCDTYIGQSVPFHLATREFFVETKRHLTPGGVLGLNLAGSLDHPFARALVRTVRESFAHLAVLRVPRSGNLLLLATEDAAAVQPRLWRERAAELDGRVVHEPSFEEIALARFAIDLDLTDVPLLVDDFAPVDYLLNLADPDASFSPLAGD